MRSIEEVIFWIKVLDVPDFDEKGLYSNVY